MNGAFPPSSIDTFLIWSPACLSRIRPTSVEPVNEIFRMTGFEQNSLPTSLERFEVTMDISPFGKPARSASTAIASAERGVSLAGRAMNAHPAASAGPALRVIIAFGKFHGVIDATTPTGCLMTTSLLSA